MPTHSPELDAKAFADRLKEAMTDCGQNSGHGAGAALSRRHKVSPYTGNAWLNGSHKPEPDRARIMADDYHVSFEWLYFGRGPKRAVAVAEETADYLVDLPLNAAEADLIRHYRQASEAMRTMVDTVLATQTQTTTKRTLNRK